MRKSKESTKQSALHPCLLHFFAWVQKRYRPISILNTICLVAYVISVIVFRATVIDSAKIAHIKATEFRHAIEESGFQVVFIPSTSMEDLYDEPQIEAVEIDDEGMIPLGDDILVKTEVRKLGTEEWVSHSLAAAFKDQLELRITFQVILDDESAGLAAINTVSSLGIKVLNYGEPELIKESHSGSRTIYTFQSIDLLQFTEADWIDDAPTYVYVNRAIRNHLGVTEEQETYIALLVIPELEAIKYRNYQINDLICNVLLFLFIFPRVLLMFSTIISKNKDKLSLDTSDDDNRNVDKPNPTTWV